MTDPFSRSIAAALAATVLLAANCLAQMQMPMGHASDSGAAVPPSQLPAPLHLTGIGTVRFPISANAESQNWFEQGINLFYDFWDYEASRAFEQSIRADPTCAICYWGLYQAESLQEPESKYAQEALDKAVKLSAHATPAHATPQEMLYIQAAKAHEQAVARAGPEGNADFSKEVDTFRTLVKRQPADTNARILLAEALEDGYDKNGQPRPGEKEARILLQGVLRDEPRNSAANHLWIHAVEGSAHPEQALDSAEILPSLAPASGHMVHMPGHIFYLLGDYARAQAAFDASTAADESYMRQQHVAVDNDWNYVHNLMYSVANLLEEGHIKEAERVSAKLVAARGHSAATLYLWSARDSIARLSPGLPVALRTADWKQVTNLIGSVNTQNPAPNSMPHLEFLAGSLSEFGLGMQAVEAHRPDVAERHSIRFDASLWRMSQQSTAGEAADRRAKDKKTGGSALPPSASPAMPANAGLKPLVQTLTIMSLELRATILAMQGHAPEARKLFSTARRREADLGYHEPPFLIRPVSESEGAALMLTGKWAEAEASYRQALTERPRSGFPLYGIALAEEKAGNADRASAAYRQFLAAWKTADADLPQVEHAQQWLASRGFPIAMPHQ